MKPVIAITAAALLGCAAAFAGEPVTLDECRRMALENNKKMLSSAVAKEKASYDVKSYKANYFPRLSATAGLLYTSSALDYSLPGAYLPTFVPDPSGSGALLPNIIPGTETAPVFKEYAYFPGMDLELDMSGTWIAGVSLQQPVYTGGKVTAAYRAAKIGERIVAAQGELTRAEVIEKTDEAYWTYVRTAQLLKTAVDYRGLVAELLRNVTDAVDAGMKPRNDMLKVQVKYNEAELRVRQASNGLNLARMNLCHVIGLPLDTEMEPVVPGADDYDVETNDRRDVTSRPEYAMLDGQVALKEQQKKIARSDFLPQVGVSAGVNYGQGLRLNGERLLDNASFSAMASVSIPIFHWGEGRNKVRSAEAERRMAELAQQDAAGMMELELARAADAYDEARLEVRLTESAVAQAEENLRLSRDGYEAGMETLADFLEAQTVWQKAEADLIEARTAMRLSATRYLKAAGRL